MWKLRTVTTQSSENTLLTYCFMYFWWLIYYKLYRIWNSKMSSQMAHLSKKAKKWACTIFFHFWAHFIDSTWKNLFEILIHENPLKTAHLSQKWARMIFSTSDPILLIVHENHQFWYNSNQYGIRNFEMSPQSDSNELKWAENEPVIFFPLFDPILFIVQSNYQFWCATLWTFYENFKWAPKSAQLSSNELKMSWVNFFLVLTPFY